MLSLNAPGNSARSSFKSQRICRLASDNARLEIMVAIVGHFLNTSPMSRLKNGERGRNVSPRLNCLFPRVVVHRRSIPQGGCDLRSLFPVVHGIFTAYKHAIQNLSTHKSLKISDLSNEICSPTVRF